jgi:lipopolysaccharide export system ATP-binding protein
VVDDVTLCVQAGEVVGLLGPNGAGKTTTFRLLTGLLEPDTGEVRLRGQLLDGPLHSRVRAGLGYLPQHPTLFRGLNVRQHLWIPLEARGASRAAAEPLLRSAGLMAFAELPATSLSGGERRRLEIARCMAGEPSVLLLDEPFAGVDPVAVGGLVERFRDLAAAGLGILLTDHAVREALGACDRVVLLVEGRVVLEGAPDVVAADPEARKRWLGPAWRG